MIKLAAGAALAGLGDHYLLNHQNPASNLAFAGSVGAGFAVGSYLGPSIGAMIPQVGTMYRTASIASRAISIASGVAGTVLMNRYVFNNEALIQFNDQRYKQIALIAACDVASEYLADFATQQPLGYLDAM